MEQAFQDGRIAELLAEYDFTQKLRQTLSLLDAETFEDFSLLAYSVIRESEESKDQVDFPWPSNGLRKNGNHSAKKQVA